MRIFWNYASYGNATSLPNCHDYSNHDIYLRNRKHVPCFYQVIETRVEVWENEKRCAVGFSTAFSSSPKLS